MVTSTTPETAPIPDPRVTAQATLDTARARVRTLEGALSALPDQYTRAAKHSNATKMKELRHEKLDLEEELLAAKIAVANAEIGSLNADFRAVCARDAEIAAEVEVTRINLATAHATYEQARLTNITAESRISEQSWTKGELRAQVMAAEARLTALVAAPMPD